MIVVIIETTLDLVYFVYLYQTLESTRNAFTDHWCCIFNLMNLCFSNELQLHGKIRSNSENKTSRENIRHCTGDDKVCQDRKLMEWIPNFLSYNVFNYSSFSNAKWWQEKIWESKAFSHFLIFGHGKWHVLNAWYLQKDSCDFY